MGTLEFIETVLPAIRARHPEVTADVVDSMFGNADFVTLKLLQVNDPAARGTGLGGAFLRDFLTETDRHEIGVEIEVDEAEPAQQTRLEAFYERFGFSGEDGVFMRWPEPAPEPSA